MSEQQNKRSRESPDQSGKSKKNQKMSTELIIQQMERLDQSIKTQFEDVKGTLATIQTTMDDAFGILKMEVEMATLQAAQQASEGKHNRIEQQFLNTSFRITGLPTASPGEAVFPLVKAIFAKVGATVQQEDFKQLYMVRHRNNLSSRISGTFYSEKQKGEAVSAFRLHRKTKPMLLGEVLKDITDELWKAKQINIRSELTLYTRKLLDQAYTHKNVFEFIWECDGRVLMKRNNNDKKTHEVKTLEQLAELIHKTTKFWGKKKTLRCTFI